MKIRPVILLLGSADEGETQSLLQHLRREECLLVDDGWLGRGKLLEWNLTRGAGPRLSLNGALIDSESLRSIFFRPRLRRSENGRPLPVLLQPPPRVNTADAAFVREEAESSLLGALEGITCLWVNHPFYVNLADRKLHQLLVAQQLGLRMPDTLVTSDPNALRAFWHKRGGRVITKAISGAARLFSEESLVTRQVSQDDLLLLDTAAPGMTLFQELIPANLDLRVTIIGDQVFCTAIHSQEGSSPLDWRLDYTVRFRPFPLDGETTTRLKKLASHLGLAYGAADLRLTPAGEIVFLEINPQGAWLFVEKLTGQPLTRAMADLLREGRMNRPCAVLKGMGGRMCGEA